MKKITLILLIFLGMHNVNAQVVEDVTVQHFNDGSTSLKISYVDCSNILTDLNDLEYLICNKPTNMSNASYKDECLKRLNFIKGVLNKALLEKDKTKNYRKTE